MKADAEANAADDEKRKELVEARNIADQAVYAAEKAIKDNGEKAGAEIVKEVQDKIDALKTARASEDAALIKSATDSLSSTLSKIGEAMMASSAKASASQEGQQPPPPPPEGSGEPKDAEFKEKP
jgi:molecular chaperone DnaK